MSGKKGRSGRKPAPKTRVDRMLAESDSQLEEIWQGLVDLAKGVRIGTVNEDGEIVNVYSKPPDREAIAEITNRHFGRTRIELDQRLKGSIEVTPDPSKVLEAHRKALEAVRAIEAEWFERGLEVPTREVSHDPDSEGAFREGEMSDNSHCANSTDSVGIPPEDPGCPPA
jgi:hypothetical protein